MAETPFSPLGFLAQKMVRRCAVALGARAPPDREERFIRNVFFHALTAT